MPRAVGRRDDILAVFIRNVSERGYERTNLGDIAEELGMSKGTIVHHFGTKAQMLRELEECYMRRQLDAVHSIWDHLDKPQERIAAVIYASALLHVVARDATVASQREVVQLADDPAMQEVRKLRGELQQLTLGEVIRGIELGVFRAVDAEIANLQMWGSMQWLWVWFDPDGSWSAQRVGAGFVDVCVGGLLTDRLCLAALADPNGEIAKLVEDCLTNVGDR
ncbi:MULTISPECIES: TetR/AcrR family transcriptional regulator [unclassified Mycobacterium]|uniref:TetR/AcrR family transcriptional regulator n=1 Tax=unclassified Mycobacterium TaxID=2642494 RepID=UPI00048AA486|nr:MULTISPECIES: TetR/AcrR family transcriptional regulator [unclassified Mycobacterium]SEA61561.1 DNA-binding transcriptional regulator, AcrR family [Mycobacterium sp. 283mftsu]